MRCPNCNFEINKKDTYCPHCGEEIRPLRNQVKNAWKDSKQRKGIKSFVKKNTLKKLVGVNLFIILSIFLIYIIDFILIYKLNIDTMSSFLTFITIILTFLLYVFGNIGIFAVALDISRKKQLNILNIYIKSFKASFKILIVILIAIYIILRIALIALYILPFLIIFNIALIICFILVLPIFTTTIIQLMDSNIPKEDKKVIRLWNEAIYLIKGHRIEYYGLLLSFAPYIILYLSALIILLISIISMNIYGLIISLFVLVLIYIIFIPYLASSLVNLYRKWLSEETFEYEKTGLNNGTIIIEVSTIAIVIIIFVNMLILWLPKSKLGDQIMYYIDNIDYNLKAKEFTLGEGKNSVTFNIPRNYKLTKDSDSMSADLENEDYIHYRYLDNSYNNIDEHYKNDIEFDKETEKENCKYNYEEFELIIKSKTVKSFSIEESCKDTALNYSYTAKMYYPINNKSSIEIWISNYDKPYKKEELKKFIDIKE